MSDCVISSSSYLMLAPQGFDCTYVILTPSDLDELKSNLGGELIIDSELYSLVSGYLLLSLIGGHVLGRIIKGLGRG